MSTKKLALLLICILGALTAGCNTEDINSTSGENSGTLTVNLPAIGTSRTFLPNVDTAIASYQIDGTGPGGSSFSTNVSSSSVSIDSLVPGSWTIIVYGKNAAGTTLYMGSSPVVIYAGNTSSISITVSPLSGNGTISINADWDMTLGSPVLVATLSNAAQGVLMITNFAIDTISKTGSVTDSSIPAGYYFLTLTLYDNGTVVGYPMMDIARIMQGQTTPVSGTFSSGWGNLNINVSNNLENPVIVTLSGVVNPLLTGSDMTVTASVSEQVDSYSWYLNGSLLLTGTSPSITLGNTLTQGEYRLDVFVTKGSVMSSTNARFTVSSTASQTFGLYAEKVPENIVWDTDAKIDVWADSGAGALVAADMLAPGFGSTCLKITGTGSWLGLAMRVEPLTNARDMSTFNSGSLKFMYKGTNGFKIGIKDASANESWLTSAELAGYGLSLDGSWCSVSVPVAAFTGLDFANIEQYFMFVSDSGTGYVTGGVHYLDEIYYSTEDGNGVITNIPPDTDYTLFSDSKVLDVIWDSDAAFDVWTDYSAGTLVATVSNDTGEGAASWSFTGTGAWIGIGMRVNPSSNTVDLSGYSYLNFMYKGSAGFKIGMKSGNGVEAWQTMAQLASYGLVQNGTWCTVKVPLSAFGSVDMSQIQQYLMFVADTALGYSVGDQHFLDHIYFSVD